jgi:DNA replication licensing factor MCM6
MYMMLIKGKGNFSLQYFVFSLIIISILFHREFFVAIYNFSAVDRVRSIRTNKIGKLMCISGTVTRTSEVRPELFYGHFICKKCGTVHSFVEQQYHYTEPSVCKNPQCANRSNFQLIIDKSSFIDWQRLRIQENADEIPAGSMPRSIDVICRNDIVEMAKAGDKVILTGMVVVIPDTSGLARMGEAAVQSKSSRSNSEFNDGISGLKKLGVKEMTYKLLFIASSIQMMDQRTGQVQMHNILPYFQTQDAHAQAYETADGGIDGTANAASNVPTPQFTEEEMLSIERMFMTSQLYNAMAESICPNVFGHMEVKRGILLMLLGGVHKFTKEGISLRGDINVCIVGDPSCAKSQFLKYVHGFLPRTIYTSGKSSSAAGLTASVVRDHDTGEFCVEAGALMLADNGICCIDEFDKVI